MANENLDDLSTELAGEFDEDTPLADEIIDTATIDSLMDEFIEEVSVMFIDIVELSMEGNPVRTHLELVNLGHDTVDLAHSLNRELLNRVANRPEKLAEVGDLLRTQVNPPVVEEN